MDVFDLESYVRDHAGIPVKRDEYLLQCPRCNKRKLQVSVAKRCWHCWVCYEREQLAGGVPALVALLDNLSLEDAIQKIAADSQLPFLRVPDLPLDPVAVPDVCLRPIAPPDGALWVDGMMPYMHLRGISIEAARARRLMYVPHTAVSRYANRLIFPVWSGARMVYWQARWMGDPPLGARKALNPPGVFAGGTLYGWEHAQRHKSVVVVEGPIDAIRVGLDAVATWGKRVHPGQIALLLTAGVHTVDLMWDADAWLDMVAAARRLTQVGLKVRLCRLPWGDPADYTPYALREVRRHAVPVPAPGLEVV